MDGNILMHEKRGFSLVELSFGLAVMLVLATMIVGISGGVVGGAKAQQEQLSLQTIAQSCRQYQAMIGQWPILLQELVDAGVLRQAVVDKINVTFIPQGQFLIINDSKGNSETAMPSDNLVRLVYVRNYESNKFNP
jgi:prepilin-type N-terminal cleavage/methylation domain-containing protein